MLVTWGPIGLAAAALGVWWALRKENKLPTVRLALGIIVGWGITVIAGAQLVQGAAWMQAQASAHLPGNWPLLVPALFIAVTAGFIVILMIGFHPKEKPDRSAEYMAIAVVVLVLLVGGSLGHHFPSLGA